MYCGCYDTLQKLLYSECRVTAFIIFNKNMHGHITVCILILFLLLVVYLTTKIGCYFYNKK